MSKFETGPMDGRRFVFKNNYSTFVAVDVYDTISGCHEIGANISIEDANALADWIKTNVAEPPKPTFKEQFDALEMGDWFTINNDPDPRIKVGAKKYINIKVNYVFNASIYSEHQNFVLTKIDPKEVAK